MTDIDDCKSKISVWWDIENCAVPKGVDPHYIAQNLSLALRHADFAGPIEINAFGDTKILEHNTQKALSDTGISLNHVPRGNKDAADKAILVAMLLWALDNPPPAHFLLISGDGDFANALHRLRLKRYSISLACPPQFVKPALLGAAKKVWRWRELAKGELSEPDLCRVTEVGRETPVQNTGPSSSSSSRLQSQRKLGPVMAERLVINSSTSSVSSRLDSPQKISDLQHKKSGKSSGSVLPENREVGVFSSQFTKLLLQIEEEKESTSTDFNTTVQSLSSYEGSSVSTLPQNTDTNDSSSPKRKSHKNSQNVLVENSVIHNSPATVSSHFASPQKTLNLQRSCSGNSAVSNLPERSEDAVFGFQFENFLVQSGGRESTASISSILDSRAQSSSLLSYEGTHGPCFGISNGHGVSSAKTTQSATNLSSVQRNFCATEIQNSLHAQAPCLPSKNSINSDSNIGMQSIIANIPACDTVDVSLSAATKNSVPGGGMPKLPVKYSSSDVTGTCLPLPGLANSRGPITEKRTMASLPLSLQSHIGGNLQQNSSYDSSLGKIYRALKTLELDMLAPSEGNIRDCIQFWDQQFENFDLKQTLSKAVECQDVVVKRVGQGLILYYPPTNRDPWHCVDPGNLQCEYPLDFWSELRQFLLYGDQRHAFLVSRNRYNAAQILRKSGAIHIGNLAIAKIILLLQQAIHRKKWLKIGNAGWSPLSIDEWVLLDHRPSRTLST